MHAEPTAVTVKIGLVPTYRFSYSEWCDTMRRETMGALARTPGVEVVAPRAEQGEGGTPHGAVHTLEEARVVARQFDREGVDGVVICPLDFGDERSVAQVADTLDVPVFLLATAEPPAREDDSLGRVSDSYCGTLGISAALHRRRIPFRFGGVFMPDDPRLGRELQTFAESVAVVKGLRGARIGQVGVRPAPFESVAYDERALLDAFGQSVVPVSLADIVERTRELVADPASIQQTVAGIRESVAQVSVTEDCLATMAGLELALGEFYSKQGLSAMAVECWSSVHRLLGIEPCAVLGRLTERGMLSACEADVVGAVSMLVSWHAVLGRTVPHFIDWTIRHREDTNRVLAWHCGNAPRCLARDSANTALRARSNMTGKLPPEKAGKGGVYQFQLRPGPVTFCRLTEYDGEWKMLIAGGEIVPSEETQCGTWSWVQVPNHDALYRTLVEEGFIHHAGMIHGDVAQSLELACRFLDIRPVMVGT